MPAEPRYLHTLFFAYVIGVLVLMFAPVPGTAPSVPQFDKVVHVAVFFGFAGLLYWDRRATPGATTTGVAFISMAAAGLVELVQIVLPYRSGSAWDFVAGALGAVAGVLAMHQLLRMAQRET
jgi:VanZ family protein